MIYNKVVALKILSHLFSFEIRCNFTLSVSTSKLKIYFCGIRMKEGHVWLEINVLPDKKTKKLIIWKDQSHLVLKALQLDPIILKEALDLRTLVIFMKDADQH